MKTKEVNKSDAIRDCLKNSSDKSPSKISKMLEEKGIKVTPTYVSVVKSKMYSSKPKTSKPNKARKSKAKAKNNAKANLESLISAKSFIDKAGSIENAKKLIDVVNKILS